MALSLFDAELAIRLSQWTIRRPQPELEIRKRIYDAIAKADNFGATPMFVACQQGHLKVCKWLCEVGAGADIRKASNSGSTPMYIACQQGHLKVCKWLYEVGAAADIRKANNYGYTPMHIACQWRHLPVCKWLYEVGAAGDITKTKNGGYTPMWSACCKGYLGVCKWLYKAGGPEAIPGTCPPLPEPPFFVMRGARGSGGLGRRVELPS